MAKKPTKPRARALSAEVERVVDEDKKQPVVENLPVPTALVLAAESIAAKADKQGMWHGVMLHSEGGHGRIVGYDGSRLFVGSFSLHGNKAPAWMKTGVLIPREGLKAQVSMIAKNSPTVVISHAKGEPVAYLSDPGKTMVFQCKPASVQQFPDYGKWLEDEGTFGDRGEDGELASKREFQPVGYNSRHLKHAGDVAKILEAALEKEKRDENGMVIRVFDAGRPDSPRIFDFVGWPGALLVLEPLWVAPRIEQQTVRLLTGALKLTVAALRAHATRWQDAAAAATTDAEKDQALARAAGFQERVAAIMAQIEGPKLALEAPAAQATPPATVIEGEAKEPKDEDPVIPLTKAERAAATRQRRKRSAAASRTMH
jgi:hypothetical protein